MNSRAKGCRGERAIRDVFREAGFTARRTQQYSGTGGTSDVTVDELPMFHFEAKCTEKKNFLDWIEQAERDSLSANCNPPLISVVCHKRNRCKKEIAMLSLDDLIYIIRRSDLPRPKKQ